MDLEADRVRTHSEEPEVSQIGGATLDPASARARSARQLSVRLPLLVSLVAGLMTIVLPTMLQRETVRIRTRIVTVVQPAQRSAGRLQSALTAEVGVELLFAREPDARLLLQRQSARVLTDATLSRLIDQTQKLGGPPLRRAHELRTSVREWRRDPDALAMGMISAKDFSQRHEIQQIRMKAMLQSADALRESLDGAVVLRRNRIQELSRLTVALNVTLALLMLASILGVAWLTRQERRLSKQIAARAAEELVLLDLARTLSATNTVSETAARIVSGAVAIANASRAYVELIDAKGNVEIIAAEGADTPAPATQAPHAAALASELLVYDQPTALSPASGLEAHVAAYLYGDCARCSGLLVPLVIPGELRGALILVRDEGRRAFGKNARRLASSLGIMSTASLRRALLADAIEAERTEKAVMLDSADDGIYTIDAAGSFTFLNRAGAKMLGYEAHEVIGRNAHALIHHSRPDGTPYPQKDCPIFGATRGSTPVHAAEEVAWRKDGTFFPADYTSSPFVRNGARGAVVMFRDVTARRAAEEERERLLASEQAARVAADTRAREEAALRATAQALAKTLTTAEITSRLVSCALIATRARGSFLSQLDPATQTFHVAAVAGDGTPSMGESIPLAGSYGEYALLHREPILLADVGKAERGLFPSLVARCKRCSVMGLPLHYDHQAIGMLWFIAKEADPFVQSDVARARIFADLGVLAFQRIRLFEQLEQRRADLAQVMASRSRLMRGFSHDVKNPLGAADGYAALLLDGAYGILQDPQLDSVRRIRTSIQNALGLIEDLHKIARAEVVEVEIRNDQVALRELLAGIVDEYRAGAEQRHLHLSLELDGAPETIATDGRRVRQILGNLLSNAIKYTDQGEVKVALSVARAGPSSQPGEWITVAVTDTGPGIPSEKLGLLFKEFSRVEPADKPGAGLGLSISERLAEALSGRITVSSSPGHGSTFTLWLPAAA